jgi:hypothetical protein
MVCELIFLAVSNFILFLEWMKFKAWWAMNRSWCPWFIQLKKGFRNGPNSLRCEVSVTYFFTLFTFLLRVIHLLVFVTQLTAVIYAGSLISCHNFLCLGLCFNSRFTSGRFLLISESVTLVVASLYAEATENIVSRAALSASTPS